MMLIITGHKFGRWSGKAHNENCMNLEYFLSLKRNFTIRL